MEEEVFECIFKRISVLRVSIYTNLDVRSSCSCPSLYSEILEDFF